jgi:hypothetical protein
LERALNRHIETRCLAAAGTIRLRVGEREVVIENGRLVEPGGSPSDDGPDAAQKEARVINRWLNRSDEARLASVTGTWATPISARPGERFKVRSDDFGKRGVETKKSSRGGKGVAGVAG